MHFNLFTPTTKVHNQRNVMRDTDLRLAIYSRRGILLSFFIFCLSIYFGEYYQSQPLMAFVLGGGILLTSSVRAYYLFRFDEIYARAPARWRNIYYAITLVGAAWWGLMLAAVTYEIGFTAETPLLWFYSIAFFSSCSHIFSPYQRFYSLYILVTLLPCALVALLSFDAIDTIYGLVMVVLLILLNAQGKNLCNTYWGHLQLTYNLAQKTNALEAEKISSQSNLVNKENLFMNLSGELKVSLREIMESLQLLGASKLPEQEQQLVTLAERKSQQQINMLQNILEFSQISRKELLLSDDVFDLRTCLEKAITRVSRQVYYHKIELFSRFSNDFPLRVRGDSVRIAQILSNIVNNAINYVDKGSMLIDISYQETNNNQGLLKITVKLDQPIRTPEVEQQLHNAFKPHYATDVLQSLDLAIAKGLASCMGGSAGADYIVTNELHFWFTAAIKTVTLANTNTQSVSKLNGKRLLICQPPEEIENEYKYTLESWGLVVDIAYEEEDIFSHIENARKSAISFDLIFIYTRVNDLKGVTLARTIAEKLGGVMVPIVICLTDQQIKLSIVEQLMERFPDIEILHKPIEYKKLRAIFKRLLVMPEDRQAEEKKMETNFLAQKRILLFQKQDIDLTIAKVMLIKLGCDVITVRRIDEAKEKLETAAYDAFIMDTDIETDDLDALIQLAKIKSPVVHSSPYIMPLLGLNNHERNGEEAKCLQHGMDYYIDTPLQIDDLRAILRRWIGRAIYTAQESETQ